MKPDTIKTQPGSVEIGEKVPNFLLETKATDNEIGDESSSTHVGGFPEIIPTTAQKRAASVEKRQETIRALKRTTAKGAVKAIDYFDTIAGPADRSLFYFTLCLIGTGDYFSAALAFAIWFGILILKIRLGPSPLTEFIRTTNKEDIRTRFVSLTKTIYR